MSETTLSAERQAREWLDEMGIVLDPDITTGEEGRLVNQDKRLTVIQSAVPPPEWLEIAEELRPRRLLGLGLRMKESFRTCQTIFTK
jgi:hypothetical protein